MTEKRIKIILETDQAKAAAKDFNASMVNIGANADKVNVSFKTTNQEINKTYDRSKQITQNITKISNDYRTIATSTATINSNIANTNRSLGGLNTSLSQIAAAVGSALSAQRVLEYSDAFTSVQNQLRQTVDSQNELEQSTKRIIAISVESRANLEATAKLYTRMRLATDEATYSGEDLYRVTETINKGLALSGASAQEAQGALLQFSQAMASGVLRGEEFNSVSEQAPIILRAVQQALGKTQAELRALAADGQLSTDVVIKAIKDYSSVVDREFAKSNRTFGQSLEVARTNAIEFVGASKLIGESVRLAGDALVGLSSNFETLQNVIAGLAVLYGARFAGSIAAATGALVINQAAALRSTTTYSAMGLAIDKTTVSMNLAAAASAGLSRAMTFLGGPVGVVLVAAASLAFFSSELEKIKAEEAAAEIDKLITKYKELDETGRRIEINKLERDRDALIARRAEVQQQIDEAKKQPQSTGGFLATGGTDGLKSNIKNSALNVELMDIEKRLDEISGKTAALFNATLPEIKGGAPSARKSSTPERNKELERLQKSIASGESKADEIFAGREEKSDVLNQSLELENELIRKSLETRASLYATYGATINDINAGYFEQQRARLELSIAEQAAREQEQLQKELAALSERRTAIQNEAELTEFGRVEALRALDEQIILQKQTTEQRLTEIQDEGRAARAALDQLEFNNKIAMAGQLGNALISFGQGQSKKIFNIGKKLALAQAAVSLPSAVIKSFENGGGYPWGLIPAAAMAAQGLQQINAIRSTTFDGGGAGGASVGGAGGTSSQPVPQLPQQQEQVQSLSLIGFEKIAAEVNEAANNDTMLPARTVQRILNSITNAQRIGP